MYDYTIITGNSIRECRKLPGESVQMVCTSPPYWGLRDYRLPPSVWGGDAGCEHEWGDVQFCRHCNAWRGCFGLEPTPELYTEHAVTIFREVRRVLKPDGVMFLNIGDSYATSPPGCKGVSQSSGLHGAKGNTTYRKTLEKSVGTKRSTIAPGLKPKDLVGIPWRVAFALQADGWWLRSDIIWAKPNPMPESVRDRPTKAHEYIFLMTKSAKYFWDQDAVREGASKGVSGSRFDTGKTGVGNSNGRAQKGYRDSDYRNIRSVWTIPTAPYPEAHFATFPPAIPERCIKAGSRDGDTVLDPFNGAGTTGLVALRLGRKYIGIELGPEYCEITERRILKDNQPIEVDDIKKAIRLAERKRQ